MTTKGYIVIKFDVEIGSKNLKGGAMEAEVKIIEGGQYLKTEKMKLRQVKEFSDDVVIYENEKGRAVIYFKEKDEYILISVDMA